MEHIILDDGLNFGMGLFETIKVVDDGRAILLKEHLLRINNSLKSLSINNSLLEEEILDYINKNNIKSKALKVIVTEKNKILTFREINYNDSHYKKGFRVGISDIIKSSKSFMIYHKTLNYGDNILEKRRMLNLGYDEALFFNEEGYLCEGCISNIFIIKKDKIYTPRTSCGLLNGVLRQWVINNRSVLEDNITKQDLLSCHGAFLTNSLMGIMPIESMDNKNIKRHDIITNLIKEYKGFEQEGRGLV